MNNPNNNSDRFLLIAAGLALVLQYGKYTINLNECCIGHGAFIQQVVSLV